MAGTERMTALADLLMAAWHAHHDATGGPDPEWPRWYAGFLDGELDPYVGFNPDVETIEEWLTIADRRFREEKAALEWAPAYAGVILELSAAVG